MKAALPLLVGHLSGEVSATNIVWARWPGDGALDAEFLFVTDSFNHNVRRIQLWGNTTVNVTTVAGSGEPGYRDGTGLDAEFNRPRGIALRPESRRLYIADELNNAIRIVEVLSGYVRSGIHFEPYRTTSTQVPPPPSHTFLGGCTST